MTELWAMVASADVADVKMRDWVAGRMNEWLAEGNAGILLVTCHRAELYGLGEPPSLPSLPLHGGVDAVKHLMRVGAGLESAIVGEDEVLHQVRVALRDAYRARPIDFRLRRLFETAVATGRRARSNRSETGGTLARNAVDWLRARSELRERIVIVAGAGRMGAALAHLLSDAGAVVSIASRDRMRAARLAEIYGGTGLTLAEAARSAVHAAAIAVALGGPWQDLAACCPRDLPPLADISAPQAVPESVRSELDGRFLGIDALYRRNESPPGAYIKYAETLVARKTLEYEAWLSGLG